MIWLSLFALVLGLGGGSWFSAKIYKRRYQRKLDKRLTQVKVEYQRQIAKMQEIQQHKQQQTKAVQSANKPEEVNHALDNLYSSVHAGH